MRLCSVILIAFALTGCRSAGKFIVRAGRERADGSPCMPFSCLLTHDRKGPPYGAARAGKRHPGGAMLNANVSEHLRGEQKGRPRAVNCAAQTWALTAPPPLAKYSSEPPCKPRAILAILGHACCRLHATDLRSEGAQADQFRHDKIGGTPWKR